MSDEKMEFEEGDKVRISFVGTIDAEGDLEIPGIFGRLFRERYIYGNRLSELDESSEAEVTLVEKAPKDWRQGDVYDAADCGAYAYDPAGSADRPWVGINGRYVTKPRGLRLFMRDGKVVNDA